tara:strand:- start:488 stop:712 length:225 start_codon:yes stop_codon:yes gene_type:complete
MRQEVLTELKSRIHELEKVAKPNDIEQGMTGSFVRFNMYIDSMTAMTQEEFFDCVYDDWLECEHLKLYKKINNL